MKAALIPPIPALGKFGQGNFHLLLSHLLEDERYLRHYKEQREKGAYLVLDNSAHEHGSGDDAEELALWAKALNAQEVVVPDTLEDGPATVESAVEAFEVWYEGDYGVMQTLDPALMYVPQGKDYEEWKECLYSLVQLHTFNAKRRRLRSDFVIGISKDYEVWDGGILKLLLEDVYLIRGQLMSKGVKVQVHLLGWGRNLWRLEEIATQCPWVRSTDSAKPFVYALGGICLPDHLNGAPPKYPTRPADYFNRKIEKNADILATVNSMVFRAMATGNVTNTVAV